MLLRLVATYKWFTETTDDHEQLQSGVKNPKLNSEVLRKVADTFLQGLLDFELKFGNLTQGPKCPNFWLLIVLVELLFT